MTAKATTRKTGPAAGLQALRKSLEREKAKSARLEKKLTEALERQTATAEILRVLGGSMTDTQPVFDAIVKNCRDLFKNSGVMLRLAADGRLHVKASVDYPTVGSLPIDRTSAIGACVVDGRTIHFPDLEEAAKEFPRIRQLGLKHGFHSGIYAPLMHGGKAIGGMSVLRRELGGFDDKDVQLFNTFADQAVIAIENVRLFNETKEALERQTATAEILKVISSSPTDVQPVFDIIGRLAEKLCAAEISVVSRFDGALIQLAALHGVAKEAVETVRRVFPMRLDEESVTARTFRKSAVVHIADVLADPEYAQKHTARAGGWRGALGVPMVREGQVIGVIFVARTTPGYFADAQVELLRTFADQAVIAIENVRLFNETKEALERQTATADILKVIASSPSDVQPVFDTIVKSALALCKGMYANVFRYDGGLLHFMATENLAPRGLEFLKAKYPMRPDASQASGRVILTKAVVRIEDSFLDPHYDPSGVRSGGWRRMLGVPMLRENTPLGVIVVAWDEPGPIVKHHEELLQTFADQAVIAIENVRLFNETKEALERQTATAEILQVIGSSPTDAQPVFDAIVNSGVRLFPGAMITVARPDGGTVRAAAIAHEDTTMVAGWRERFTTPLSRDRLHAAAILDAKLIDFPDAEAEKDGPLGPGVRNFLLSGNRAVTIMPMLRGEGAIGAISVTRAVPGPLSDKQIAILRTFADQAVIAIENVRLFKELQSRTEALTRSVGQLTALGEVGQAISSTLDLGTVLKTIVSRAVQLTGLNGGSIYEFEEGSGDFHLRAAENMPEELVEVYRRMPIRLGEGIVGGAAARREPMQVPDIQDQSYQTRYRELLIRQGYRAILAVPLLRDEQIIGALTVSRNEPGAFAPEVVELLKTFATQSALAIQNARLFREIGEKGRQLEVASRHKSDFLASMSHELRTPLNAILGFNEMILGQIYGEVPAEMLEPLADIQASGKHLLRLINNVLDLAKIEAGRMELALADYSVHDTVESVRSTLRPLATDKGLEFVTAVPHDLPLAYGDVGRITQCLMNLAGNSLKFTKAGKVEISVALKDGALLYRVADTGIGIAPDKIETVFAEFRQSDATIASEYGGTGLGLSISRKFVEMHGGRIWVESELGKGSAFLFEIPLRVRQGATA